MRTFLPDQFLTAAYLPFSLACGLLVALLAVEIVALLLGGSLIFDSPEGPDISLETSAFDLDADAVPDTAALIAAADGIAVDGPAAAEGAPGLLGLGHTPFMIWFAALLLGFGLSGFAVQMIADAALGAPLMIWIAVPVALIVGLIFARLFSRSFARLIPGFETTATSTQFMGGLRGTISQGTARAGSPAEVRLRDRHGNLHHLRCEPLLPDDVIPEGAEVLTVRQRIPEGGWLLRIIPVT